MKGKVITFDVHNPVNEMQVVHKNQLINLVGDMLTNQDLINQCKLLYVEYSVYSEHFKTQTPCALPLIDSQWEIALDNYLDDSEAEVDFEIVDGSFGNYVKIINPKTSWNKAEVEEIIRKVYCDGYERATANLHWSGEINKAVNKYLKPY